jgi:hypothetical protein
MVKRHDATKQMCLAYAPAGSARTSTFLLNFLEPRLVLARSTIIIPLYNRVIFVRLLNGSEFSSRLSKISQAHDTISGIQFLVGSPGLDERWTLGSVCISSCSCV